MVTAEIEGSLLFRNQEWTQEQKHSISIDFMEIRYSPGLNKSASANAGLSKCPCVPRISARRDGRNVRSPTRQSPSNQGLPLSQPHEEVAVFLSSSPISYHATERSVANRPPSSQTSKDLRLAAISWQPIFRTIDQARIGRPSGLMT
jgi:hypothetical protein